MQPAASSQAAQAPTPGKPAASPVGGNGSVARNANAPANKRRNNKKGGNADAASVEEPKKPTKRELRAMAKQHASRYSNIELHPNICKRMYWI